jgi:hypothetical protein
MSVSHTGTAAMLDGHLSSFSARFQNLRNDSVILGNGFVVLGNDFLGFWNDSKSFWSGFLGFGNDSEIL